MMAMNAVEVPEGVMNPILEPRTPGDGAGTSTVFSAKRGLGRGRRNAVLTVVQCCFVHLGFHTAQVNS